MKKKPIIQFSIHDYNYLDTLDLDGWRWEFMRRLPSFRSDYEFVKDQSEYQHGHEWWNLGEKYSMTKEARQYFNLLDPLRTYPNLPDNLKPVFEETVPIKSLHREKLLKEIRKTLKHWSYAGKDNPILHLEPEQGILLAVEMSLRPGMFPQNVEYMGINLQASRTELKSAFETFLKSHIREKTGKGDEKQFFGTYKMALLVWDLRAQRKTFPDIQSATGIDKDAAKKKFYRAYELIYGKKYNPCKYEKPLIKKKYIKRICSTCDQQSTCKVLCPDVIGYVDQDSMKYQREMTGGNIIDTIDKLKKNHQKEKSSDSDLLKDLDDDLT